MRNEWILDVLTDLRTFAAANGLGALAEQLDDTTLVAAAEIASQSREAFAEPDGERGERGSCAGGPVFRHRA